MFEILRDEVADAYKNCIRGLEMSSGKRVIPTDDVGRDTSFWGQFLNPDFDLKQVPGTLNGDMTEFREDQQKYLDLLDQLARIPDPKKFNYNASVDQSNHELNNTYFRIYFQRRENFYVPSSRNASVIGSRLLILIFWA